PVGFVCGLQIGGFPLVALLLFVLLMTTAGITTTGTTERIPSVIPKPWLKCEPALSAFAPAAFSPIIVPFTAWVNSSSVACVGGKGEEELSPLRTLLICPAFTITHTPALLQSLTSPSKTTAFIWPVV